MSEDSIGRERCRGGGVSLRGGSLVDGGRRLSGSSRDGGGWTRATW